MSNSRTIRTPEDVQPALQWAYAAIMKGIQSAAVVMELGRESRSTDQNSKLWPMLTDISKVVEWYGKMYSKEEWKDIITGSFRNCEFVPNISGNGFVVVGLRTSKMSPSEFSDLIEFIYSFGAENNVPWSEPALKSYEQYRTKP